MDRRRRPLEGQKVKRRIAEQNSDLFHTIGWSVWVAFPGFGGTIRDARPPRELFFVTPASYGEVLREALYGDGKGVIITGPKGAGTSCVLRALAVELIGRLPKRCKVVCFWYSDALEEVSSQIRDALLFTYGDAGSEVIAEIQGIATVEHLSRFLATRKTSGDSLIMVSDGDETYDIEGRDGLAEEQRRGAEAKKWLEAFDRHAFIRAVAPEAARGIPERMTAYELQAENPPEVDIYGE